MSSVKVLSVAITCLCVGYFAGKGSGLATIVDSLKVTKSQCEVIHGKGNCKLDMRYINK